jgi:hypothetical protein
VGASLICADERRRARARARGCAQSSHRFPVDVAKALLSAGALVTLRRLRGGPAAAGAASPPLQLRLLYPLSVSLLQHDCIVPR